MPSYLKKYQFLRVLIITAFMYFGIACFYAAVAALFPRSLEGIAHGPIATLALFVFSAACFVSSVGLLRRKKFGITIGYFVPLGLFVMFMGEAYTHWSTIGAFNLEDIMWSALFFSAPLLTFIGFRRLDSGNGPVADQKKNTAPL